MTRRIPKQLKKMIDEQNEDVMSLDKDNEELGKKVRALKRANLRQNCRRKCNRCRRRMKRIFAGTRSS